MPLLKFRKDGRVTTFEQHIKFVPLHLGAGVRFRGEATFHLATATRPTLRHTQSPVQWVIRLFNRW